jgi:hypothetical protein
MNFIGCYDQNKILLAVYPPHSTQTLPPLDVAMFKPLATGYSKKVAVLMERSHDLTSMSKRDVFPLFCRAWKVSFEATGLSPFNSKVILKRFNTSPSSSNSEFLALSLSDWRKIRQLFDHAVSRLLWELLFKKNLS